MSSQYKGKFIGDVFLLSTVYDTQIKNVEDGNFASWPESAIYGYFAGGPAPSPPPSGSSLIRRLNFSNETVSNPGNTLPVGRLNVDGLANAINSYFGGGFFNPPITGTYVSTITRQNFSNETVSNPGNNLPVARSSVSAISSSSYGYFGGGYNSAPNAVSTISRLDFSTESINNTTNLPVARGDLFAVETRSYGYFIGGNSTSIINRLDFSNDTISNPGNLPSNRNNSATFSNNSYGYFASGQNPGFTIGTNLSRLDFSVETISDLGNILPSPAITSGTATGGQSV